MNKDKNLWTEADFLRLPSETRQFVLRLVDLGLDRTRIYGFLVMLGLYVGAPNTQENIEALLPRVQKALPIDRSKNIDEEIGHLYDGYDREINEFCFRCGVEFEFREIIIPNVEKTLYLINLKDEGLLNPNIKAVDKLSDSTRLFDSFVLSLGQSSIKRGASLLEAFSCGIFQMQLHTQIDVQGTMQIARVIKNLMPPFYSRCFNTITSADIDYFLGLEAGQIALLDLMLPMESSYALQMWNFQSYLFFNNGNLIEGVDKLSLREWFLWVLDKSKEFDIIYKSDLLPLSKSKVQLSELPSWGIDITSFEVCDAYIGRVWGYNAESINGPIESLEYKALIVHLIYSSLTSSRETLH